MLKINNINQSMIGNIIATNGWLSAKRNLGGIFFGEIQQQSGKIQFLIEKKNKELYSQIFEKYFQFARCFRAEGMRSNRQLEFT